MKEADVTKLLRTENGSAACGSSCQRLIKHKNQGHFSSWAISSEDGFFSGRGIKIHLDAHFSWLLSLNQTYLVRGTNRRSDQICAAEAGSLSRDIQQDRTRSEHLEQKEPQVVGTGWPFERDYRELLVQIISIIWSQTKMAPPWPLQVSVSPLFTAWFTDSFSSCCLLV